MNIFGIPIKVKKGLRENQWYFTKKNLKQATKVLRKNMIEKSWEDILAEYPKTLTTPKKILEGL